MQLELFGHMNTVVLTFIPRAREAEQPIETLSYGLIWVVGRRVSLAGNHKR